MDVLIQQLVPASDPPDLQRLTTQMYNAGQPELVLLSYRNLNEDWSGPELETISGYNRS